MQSFINFLAGILGEIMESVLEPILVLFIKNLVNMLKKYLTEWIGWVLYYVYSLLLKFIDFLYKMMGFFSGSNKVAMNHNGQKTEGSLLNLLFNLDEIKTAFLVITILAVGMCIIFTIVAVTRSISDMTLENKNPVGKVLRSALKAAFSFMLIPFMCVFMLQISTLVLNGIDEALGANSNVSVANVLWLNSSMNACNTPEYNLNEGKKKNLGANDEKRKPYYYGDKSWAYDSKDLQKDFSFAKFDYISGFASAIFMIFILMGCVVIFIQRIFELLILYIVAPFFVSTMPLDDGAMFQKWKDMFIAKFFSAFGIVYSMRIFMMIVPYLVNGTIELYPSNSTISFFLKNIFIVSGAWAVYKSQNMLLRMINYEAAAANEQAGGLVSGMIGGAVGVAKSFGGSAGHRKDNKDNKQGTNSSSKKDYEKQAFESSGKK